MTGEIESGIINVAIRQPDAVRWQSNATYSLILRLIPGEIFVDPFLFDAHIRREDLRLLFLRTSSEAEGIRARSPSLTYQFEKLSDFHAEGNVNDCLSLTNGSHGWFIVLQ